MVSSVICVLLHRLAFDHLLILSRIIVGVKYCFRYNQRNRQLRTEDGDPIEIGAMPRTHRRRREKKLMTMEEVNERFPLIKYKQWRSTRAEEGLPTAGGITAPSSRAASLRNEPGTVQRLSPPEQDAGSSKEVAASPSSATFPPNIQTTEKDFAVQPSVEQQPNTTESIKDTKNTTNNNTTTTTTTSTTDHALIPPPYKHSMHDDDDEEDHDQIQPTVPAELLPNPGDTCAICLDIIEDDDDIRGLACGHAFHASCVDPWLTSRRACCPLCKADYYVPKPRNDGTQENDEENRNRGRVNMPPNPPFAFLGGPGGTRNLPFLSTGANNERATNLAGRSRMILPGRFMTIVYADNDRRGYGFPQVVRHQRPDGETGRTGRRWFGSRNTPNDSSNTDTVNNNVVEHRENEQTSTGPANWRDRFRSMRPEASPAQPSTGRRFPFFSGRSRSGATTDGVNTAELQPQSQQRQQEISPGQLEAGTATSNARTTTTTC